MATKLKKGQTWRSKDTGNRWKVLAIGESGVTVLALDGGRFGDATYHFDASMFVPPRMELVKGTRKAKPATGSAPDGRRGNKHCEHCKKPIKGVAVWLNQSSTSWGTPYHSKCAGIAIRTRKTKAA